MRNTTLRERSRYSFVGTQFRLFESFLIKRDLDLIFLGIFRTGRRSSLFHLKKIVEHVLRIKGTFCPPKSHHARPQIDTGYQIISYVCRDATIYTLERTNKSIITLQYALIREEITLILYLASLSMPAIIVVRIYYLLGCNYLPLSRLLWFASRDGSVDKSGLILYYGYQRCINSSVLLSYPNVYQIRELDRIRRFYHFVRFDNFIVRSHQYM